VQTPFGEGSGKFSPDGRWVAYGSNASGRQEVYVTPFPGPGGKWQISTAGGSQPEWRNNGREILYLAPGGKVMSAAVDGRGSNFEVSAVRTLFEMRTPFRNWDWDITADGQRFLFNTIADEADPSLTLLVNWTAALPKPH
jgi:Tol biopolymer transport system component